MPIVDIYGEQVEFPDDLPEDQLNSAVKAAAAQLAPRKTGAEIDQQAYQQAWQGQRDISALTDPNLSPISRAGAALKQGARQGMVQVGRGMSDIITGAGQLGRDIATAIPGVPDFGRGLDVQAEQSEEAGKFLSGQPGGVLGPMAGGVALTAPLAAVRAPAAVAGLVNRAAASAPVATRIGTGAAIGAGYGAAAPVTDERTRTGNVATGAAAGAAGAGAIEVLGRVISPIQQAVDKNRERMVKLAESLGVKLTPGQRTGSVPLQQLEASLASNPITSGPLARIKEENQRALNRAAAESFGEKADDLTEEVIDNAYTRLGKVFEDSTKGLRVNLDDQFRNDLGQVVTEYRASLPSLRNPKIEALVDDVQKTLLSPSGQQTKLKGEIYQKIVSDLSRVSRSAARGENADQEYARALLSIKEVMDDAAARVMPAETQQAFRQARGQYRNLMTVVNSGAVKGQNIAPRTLKTAMSRKDRAGMARGRDQSQLARAARVGEYFQPIVGDSGTATRMSTPLMLGGTGAASGGAALGMGVDPMTALGIAAAPLAAQGIANLGTRAYLSPAMQRYMQGGIIDELTRKSATQAGGIFGLLGNQ